MAAITPRTQEHSNWCWAACIQMLLGLSPPSQGDIVGKVIKNCLGGSPVANPNVQLPRELLPCAFGTRKLRARFEPGTPLAEDALTWANKAFMAICFGSDQADGHVVMVSGVSNADKNNPVFVIIDPRLGEAGAMEIPYDQLFIGADFKAGGWDGTVVSDE